MKTFRFLVACVLIGRILSFPISAQPPPPSVVGLTVNSSTAAIVGPQPAATFASANNLATATGGIVLGANGGTGIANTGKTITLGGNLVTSGAFATTLTATATTSVTLPTTGTLATLAGSESLTNKKLGSLTSNGLVTTSGADGTLSVTVPGTGVLAALGVNIGSAGAPVLFNGALGTPTSGTVTNLTGTASININGTVGATTPAAGTFTSVTNSGLTATRVPFAGTGGLMTDDPDMTFATDTLTVTKGTFGGITHVANAIAEANSVTAASATNLTLTGGSSGASLVLGQGTNGGLTFSPAGNGVFQHTTAGAQAAVYNFKRTTATSTVGAAIGYLAFQNGATDVAYIQVEPGTGDATNGRMAFYTKATAGAITQNMTLTSTGNLLIGGTTDITGAGGLKVFGTTASTSTTTGSLINAGGFGNGGAANIGTDLTVGAEAATPNKIQLNGSLRGSVSGYTANGTSYGSTIFTAGGSYGFGRSAIIGANGGSSVFAIKTNPLGVSSGVAGVTGAANDAGGGLTAVGVYGYTLYNQADGTGSSTPTGGIFLAEITSATSNYGGNLRGLYAKADSSAATSSAGTITGGYLQAVGKSGDTTYGARLNASGGTTNNGLYVETGLAKVLDTTEATTGGAGSLTTAGGIYAAKKIITSTDLIVGKTASTTPSALTYASPTSVDVTLSSCFTVTTVNATGSVTFNATAGGTAGQRVVFIITNDATSAKTITFGTNFSSMGTLTPAGANKVATIEFISNGTTLYELCRSVIP